MKGSLATPAATGQFLEKELDEFQPGSTGRGEVKVELRMLAQPSTDCGVLTILIGVDDKMELPSRRGLRLDLLKKAQPLVKLTIR
jgi:hypothetical protein